jgi:hypothetical protein
MAGMAAQMLADSSLPAYMPNAQPFMQNALPVCMPNAQAYMLNDPPAYTQNTVMQPTMFGPAFYYVSPEHAQNSGAQEFPRPAEDNCGVGGMPLNHFQAADCPSPRSTEQTGVCWMNLPNNYTRDELVALIDSYNFAGYYDFFCSPIDFTNKALLGYAFINFVSEEKATEFWDRFQDFTQWKLKSEKVSEVAWSEDQGLHDCIERWRNSPVMHPDVPDTYRPLFFRDGQRVPFPAPTRKLKAPHLKFVKRQGNL